MSEYNKLIFAGNLLYYMKRKGVRATDISDMLGVSKSTVSSWLNGQKTPRMDKIETLSDYFGISKSALIEEPHTDAGKYTGSITAGISPVKQELMRTIISLSEDKARLVLDLIKRILQEQA